MDFRVSSFLFDNSNLFETGDQILTHEHIVYSTLLVSASLVHHEICVLKA